MLAKRLKTACSLLDHATIVANKDTWRAIAPKKKRVASVVTVVLVMDLKVVAVAIGVEVNAVVEVVVANAEDVDEAVKAVAVVAGLHSR